MMRGGRGQQASSFMQQLSLPGLNRPRTPRRVLPTPTEQALDCARVRLVFFALLFIVAYAVIGIRLTGLTVFNNPNASSSRREIAAANIGRAGIVDRNGVILATSLPTISACAEVKAIDDPEATAAKIGTILPELDIAKLAGDLATRKGCVTIKRHLTPRQYYALNNLGIAGVGFSRDERRAYPQGALTAHVVGLTDIDNIGIAGIEKKLDARLRQQIQPARLALDVRVQNIMRRELAAAIKEFRAIGGAGIIMDAVSGEVVAMVSLPDFDPHDTNSATDTSRFNRATLGVYEPGSTFKLLTAAQALDIGEARMTDSFNAVDPIQIGRRTIRDFHPENRWLTLPEIIMVSSNIGAARIADKIGGVRQRAFLDQLGMFQPAPIELPESGHPIAPSSWGETATLTIGFGHGLAVAPMQMVRSIAALVNDGRRVTPTLLLQPGGEAARADQEASPVISPATSAKIRAMMRLVVAAGTAKSANVDGYIVGGKTGTAEKIIGRGYNKNARLSSFIGAFPMQEPRYIIYAMLDEPQGNKATHGFATGGWVAAPLAGRVIAEAAPLLGLPPQEPGNFAAADRQLLRPLGVKLLSELMPTHDTNHAPIITALGEH